MLANQATAARIVAGGRIAVARKPGRVQMSMKHSKMQQLLTQCAAYTYVLSITA
jgi:hypothetical protein